MDELSGDVSEDYEMEESDSRDRLSELPNSLIHHILSFLPMRDVVSTTLLSKRWKNLWTTVPSLNFIDDVEDDDYPDRVRNFVNRALIFWEGSKIQKFKIDFSTLFDMSLWGDVDLWVRFAKEKKVEELCIHLTYDEDAIAEELGVLMGTKEAVYWTPQCIYTCSSLKNLSLVGCNLQVNGSVHWNQLKSLRIDGYCFGEHVINKVLSGTPQLEVFMLRLHESDENLNIQSSSLKKLTIEKYILFSDDPSMKTVLRIWCPNLETSSISGVLYREYLLMNISSLTDVTLGFCGANHYDDDEFSWTKLLGETLSQIFPTLQHVEKVTLLNWCIQVLGAKKKKKYLLSPLSSVKFLKLDVSFIELDKIVNLLKIFPKVETLVIEDNTGYGLEDEFDCQFYFESLCYPQRHIREPSLEFDAKNSLQSVTYLPKSFLLQLRTIEVALCLRETSIFPLIEFLLRHASMLEKMVIRARKVVSLSPESLILAEEKLLSMPRSSPTAKVILHKE